MTTDYTKDLFDEYGRPIIAIAGAETGLEDAYGRPYKALATLPVPTGRAGSYIIAAADAPDTWKAQADALCDGAADEVQINAAIAAGHRDILLSTGTFYLADSLQSEDDNLHLHGAGKATILTRTANITLIEISNASEVILEKLALVSDRTAYSGDGLSLANCVNTTLRDIKFSNINGQALQVETCYGLQVEDCLFAYCGESAAAAVRFTAASDKNTHISFRGCLFEPNYYADVEIVNALDSLRFESCWFEGYDSGGGVLQPAGAHLKISCTVYGVFNVYIDKCKFYMPAGWSGQQVDCAYANQIKILNSSFSRGGASSGAQIYLRDGGNDCLIEGCSFMDSEGYSIDASKVNLKVNNCTFTTCVNAAIRFEYDAKVTNCKFISCPEGVRVRTSEGSVIGFNHFTGGTTDIVEQAAAVNCLYIGNYLTGATSFSGTTPQIRSNIGLADN